MRHVGIICEFNPLHTGHAHLLSVVREAKTVICLMSGPFVQRGEVAILPPHVRAAMAIEAGADLVLELPYPYAAASARYFATAGVGALASLGVDTLAFGSEVGDVDRLAVLAARAPESNQQKRAGNVAQKTGDARAYFEILGAEISANDILGVEYLRAMRKSGTDMKPLVVRREGANYTETALREGTFPSATALRGAIFAGDDVGAFIPPLAHRIFCEGIATYGIADTVRLGAPLLAALRHPDAAHLFAAAAECDGGLLGRLQRAARSARNYGELLALTATKRYTNARIRRALLFLLSGVQGEDLTAPPAYLRLLALNDRGRAFLTQTKKSRTIPVVTKPSEIAALGERVVRARALAAAAEGLYTLCMEKPMSMHVLQTPPPYLQIGT